VDPSIRGMMRIVSKVWNLRNVEERASSGIGSGRDGCGEGRRVDWRMSDSPWETM